MVNPAHRSATGGALEPHRFRRDSKGMVKLRLNLTSAEADLIEAAADGTPVMSFLRHSLIRQAQRDIQERGEHVPDH